MKQLCAFALFFVARLALRYCPERDHAVFIAVYSVDLSSDGKLLATGDQHKKAQVWDIESAALVHTLKCSEVVKRVHLSDDASLLATGSGDMCQIWDLHAGIQVTSNEMGGRVWYAMMGTQTVRPAVRRAAPVRP